LLNIKQKLLNIPKRQYPKNETIWFDESFDEIPYYFFHQKNYPQSVNTDKIFEMCKNVQQI